MSLFKALSFAVVGAVLSLGFAVHGEARAADLSGMPDQAISFGKNTKNSLGKVSREVVRQQVLSKLKIENPNEFSHLKVLGSKEIERAVLRDDSSYQTVYTISFQAGPEDANYVANVRVGYVRFNEITNVDEIANTFKLVGDYDEAQKEIELAK